MAGRLSTDRPDQMTPDNRRFLLNTEIRRIGIALGYFTRLSIPASVGWSADELNRAARYFPLIGTGVGLIAALVLVVGASLWSPATAVVLSMVATVLLTGALHEDGLADSADGFGGGYTRERVLSIMQDSRIGSFGAVALILALLGKFALLSDLIGHSLHVAATSLVIAHTASRSLALLVMATLPYAKPDEASKARPVADGIGPQEWAIGLGIGLAPLVLALAPGTVRVSTAIAVLLAGALTLLLATRYFRRRIGGYTGDCLGAVQQVSELAIYLAILATLT